MSIAPSIINFNYDILLSDIFFHKIFIIARIIRKVLFVNFKILFIFDNDFSIDYNAVPIYLCFSQMFSEYLYYIT